MAHVHQEISADEHAQIALDALTHGDLDHALHHVVSALAEDPAQKDYLTILDRVCALHPDPAALTALSAEGVTLAEAAVHGYALIRCGAVDEGVRVFTQCFDTGAAAAHMSWLGVLCTPVERVLEVDEEAWLRMMVTYASKFPGDSIQDPDLIDLLVPCVPMFAHRARHSDHAELHYHTGLFLRKVGAHDIALELCEHAYRLHPDSYAADALAMVCSARGDLEGKQRWYERSVELDQDHAVARLELGDLHGHAGRFDEALSWYQSVLERDPHQPWAQVNAQAMRYLIDPSSHPQDLLPILAQASSSHPHGFAFHTVQSHTTRYLAWLPGPTEAIIDVTYQLLQQSTQPHGELHIPAITSSAVEAPGAVLAVSLVLGGVPTITMCGEPHDPDPRQPHGEVSRQLWHYDDYTPSPSLPAPEQNETLELLHELVRGAFFLPVMFEQAIARKIPASSHVIDTLLAAIAHPPDAPIVDQEWPWFTQHRRVWSACVMLAALHEEEWFDGQRRQALHDLIRGPYDWSVAAAVVVLGELAMTMERDDPARIDILEELARMGRLLEHGQTECWIEPWLRTMLRFDELSPTALSHFSEALRSVMARGLAH